MTRLSAEAAFPHEEGRRAYLESLVRADYERCHPGEGFDDMKRRMAFAKEDKGMYRDWMALAALRAEEASETPLSVAA